MLLLAHMIRHGIRMGRCKEHACAADRGFDFNYASRASLDPQRITTQDLRWNYGEERFCVLADI